MNPLLLPHAHILSLVDHGNQFVRRMNDGTVMPMFAYDATGVLLWMGEVREFSFSRIPRGTRCMVTKDEIEGGLPYHLTRGRLEALVLNLYEQAPQSMKAELDEIYPAGTIGVYDDLFFPEVPDKRIPGWIDDESILRMADYLDSGEVSEEACDQTLHNFSLAGVLEIPLLDRPMEGYIEFANDKPSEDATVELLQRGWVWNRRVVRKAVAQYTAETTTEESEEPGSTEGVELESQDLDNEVAESEG